MSGHTAITAGLPYAPSQYRAECIHCPWKGKTWHVQAFAAREGRAHQRDTQTESESTMSPTPKYPDIRVDISGITHPQATRGIIRWLSTTATTGEVESFREAAEAATGTSRFYSLCQEWVTVTSAPEDWENPDQRRLCDPPLQEEPQEPTPRYPHIRFNLSGYDRDAATIAVETRFTRKGMREARREFLDAVSDMDDQDFWVAVREWVTVYRDDDRGPLAPEVKSAPVVPDPTRLQDTTPAPPVVDEQRLRDELSNGLAEQDQMDAMALAIRHLADMVGRPTLTELRAEWDRLNGQAISLALTAGEEAETRSLALRRDDLQCAIDARLDEAVRGDQ